MRVILVLIILCLWVVTAQAQQPSVDPETLQQAISAARSQRIAADDRALDAEVRAARLQAQLAKAEARIKELENPSKPNEPKK